MVQQKLSKYYKKITLKKKAIFMFKIIKHINNRDMHFKCELLYEEYNYIYEIMIQKSKEAF